MKRTQLPLFQPTPPQAPSDQLALRVQAAGEATRHAVARLLAAEPPPTVKVQAITDAVDLLWPLFAGREIEALGVLALDRRGQVVDLALLTTGCDAFTIVDPKQVLRWTLTRHRPATAVVLAHNHPSGSAQPSPEDREVTHRMASACMAVGLTLGDHLILTNDRDRWFSFAESGELPLRAAMGPAGPLTTNHSKEAP